MSAAVISPEVRLCVRLLVLAVVSRRGGRATRNPFHHGACKAYLSSLLSLSKEFPDVLRVTAHRLDEDVKAFAAFGNEFQLPAAVEMAAQLDSNLRRGPQHFYDHVLPVDFNGKEAVHGTYAAHGANGMGESVHESNWLLIDRALQTEQLTHAFRAAQQRLQVHVDQLAGERTAQGLPTMLVECTRDFLAHTQDAGVIQLADNQFLVFKLDCRHAGVPVDGDDVAAAHARTVAQQLPRDMAYSADVAARVNAEAAEAIRMPGWFWVAGPLVFVGTVALSAVFPWGFA